MAFPSKYKPKYARQLKNGLCRDGKSVEECCQEWGVTVKTYYDWIEKYPAFARGHELAAIDRRSWWERIGRLAVMGEIKTNAAIYNFTMANLHGWSNKTINENVNESIGTININVLPAPKQEEKLIEQKDVIDVTPSNVVKLHDETKES